MVCVTVVPVVYLTPAAMLTQPHAGADKNPVNNTRFWHDLTWQCTCPVPYVFLTQIMHAATMPHVSVQVDQADGAFSAQLLPQVETYLLLHLMLLQLTASIPDSYPGAQPARDMVCRLYCGPLYDLYSGMEQRCVKLPKQGACLGPQLALQLLPWPPGLQALPQQQRQQQQQQLQREEEEQPDQREQLAEWGLVVPTATLLTQLLPLLSRHWLAQQRQQQQQQGDAAEALLATQSPGLWPTGIHPLVMCLASLLICSVMPAPDAAAEGSPPPLHPPAAAAAAAAAAVAAAGAGDNNSEAPHNCVLHAQDAFLPHANDIISTFEAGIRIAACCAAAATAAARAAVAAATAAGGTASGVTAAAAAGAAVASASDACDCLKAHVVLLLVSGLCFVHGCQYRPSPLVFLARAAGPGSQVQRHFYSLLATVVKLSSLGLLDDRARWQLCAPVSDAVSELLARAAAAEEGQQQQQQQETKGATAAAAAAVAVAGGGGEFDHGSGNAVDMLPNVFLLGRCCMRFAELLNADLPPSREQQDDPSSSQEQQQQRQQGDPSSNHKQRQQPEDPCSSQEQQDLQQEQQQQEQEQQQQLCSSQEQQQQQPGYGNNIKSRLDLSDVLSAMQQWLQAGSTCNQLVAAGYAPRAVLQQLQEVSAAWRNLQHIPSDTAALPAAAQLLQATWLALCSFAVPCMCNNPGCTSMAGLSELAAVSGRSCICGGCRVARYCGRACQRAAWKQHKPVCGALGAAAGCGADFEMGC
jgi:hypothetical protein